MNTRVVIGIIILVWAAIVVVFGLRLFSPQAQVLPQANDVRISDYSTNSDAEARLTILGPVVANENFRSGMITVSPSSRSVTAYRTYNEEVIQTDVLGNNSEAFRQFMNALQLAGFGQRRRVGETEPGSACAQGYRYIYELREGGRTVMQTWATSCGLQRESFSGSVAQVNRLFRVQIPGLNQSDNYDILSR